MEVKLLAQFDERFHGEGRVEYRWPCTSCFLLSSVPVLPSPAFAPEGSWAVSDPLIVWADAWELFIMWVH